MSDNGYSSDRMKYWNPVQFALIAPCLLPIVFFSGYVLDSYLGSGWTLICGLLFTLLFASPFCYVQFRTGSTEGAGMLNIFSEHFPLGNVAGIACICTNLIKLIVGVCLMTYSLAYVFFTYYHCDGRHCVGSLYIWGSCRDSWSEGYCLEYGCAMNWSCPLLEVTNWNYVLERSDGIIPLNGFPSWFLTTACVVPSYLIAWFLVFAITIPGHRSFGLGWLSSFVHLSQGLNLWTGVFPMLGKWSGPHGKRTYLSWIPLLVLWQVLIQLPVLLFVFAMASSYYPESARCHLSTDWQAPFLIMSHVFSKFSSDRLLAGCFFVSLMLCILLSQSLLLLTTVRTITDFVTPPCSASSKRQRCAYRTTASITTCLLLLIGLPMITRAGFYWMRLVNWYVDRMLVIIAPLQAIGYTIAYVKTGGRFIQKANIKLGIVVGSVLLNAFSVAVYLWYLIAATEPSPDTNCPTYSRAPEHDPIHSDFRVLGWIIAIGPVLLGFLFTAIIVARQSSRAKTSVRGFFSSEISFNTVCL
ncbi:hypothetical protein FBUS_09592 [Fasciolopsis buskii]|uniref:Uncharacterized protein n=1 Tax=Fasciolopsis buskii TaxID=27845 RepID=A0A8E0VPF8_9TREM|nr:hypothetical protein FBUS_09592 [Fasciolopsis buski]